MALGAHMRPYSYMYCAPHRDGVLHKQPGVTCEQKQKEKIQAYTSAVPFPQRLQKTKRMEQFSKFLEIFKKIEINIPFAEAITQMPNYAKFLKDILSKRRRLLRKE